MKSAVKPLVTGKVEDWHGEYAYSLGLQAFIYGFPYIYNAQTRYKWVTQPRNPKFVPYAALNEFWHASQLMDATYRDGGCPNNDTLYSIAWLDLSEEPIILSHPDMGERYFTFELMGVGSDNFDYIGQRTTGSKAGSFAIVGPDWEGELPDDVDQLPRALAQPDGAGHGTHPRQWRRRRRRGPRAADRSICSPRSVNGARPTSHVPSAVTCSSRSSLSRIPWGRSRR